jgi:hypothetical protein
MNWKIINEKKLLTKFKAFVVTLLIIIIYTHFDLRLLHKSPGAAQANALINKR